MTRTRMRPFLALLAATLLAGALAGCGRYGPPQPYPPGVEAPEDEEERS